FSNLRQHSRELERRANHHPAPGIDGGHPSIPNLINRNIGLHVREWAGEPQLPMLHVAHDSDNPVTADLRKGYRVAYRARVRKISSRQLGINHGNQRRVDGVLLADEPSPNQRYSHNSLEIGAADKTQCSWRFCNRGGPVGINPEGEGVDLMAHRYKCA